MKNSRFAGFDSLTTEEQNEINFVVNSYNESLRSIEYSDGLINQCLSKVEPNIKEQLLYELLQEEHDKLQRHGAQHCQVLLSERFPDYPEVVRAVACDRVESRGSIDVDRLLKTPDLIQGFQFGKFNLVRLVGQGEFGAVFEAEDKELRRRVALKISKKVAREVDFSLLMEEARNAAAVSHQNIVRIYEAGFQGSFYVASELIDGPNLRELMQKQNLRHDNAIEIVRALAGGVAYAHLYGIVHNDIKPENILIDSTKTPKLADFGLAQST
ncbi:MAG: serine/threonine-protein kinase, partial [Planctomycetota bacterium]